MVRAGPKKPAAEPVLVMKPTETKLESKFSCESGQDTPQKEDLESGIKWKMEKHIIQLVNQVNQAIDVSARYRKFDSPRFRYGILVLVLMIGATVVMIGQIVGFCILAVLSLLVVCLLALNFRSPYNVVSINNQKVVKGWNADQIFSMHTSECQIPTEGCERIRIPNPIQIKEDQSDHMKCPTA